MRSPRRSRLSCFDADPLLSDGASPPSALSLSLDEDGDVFVALPVLGPALYLLARPRLPGAEE